MDINKISCGKNPPEEVNVVIEIPAGGAPVKYEFDKDSGALLVDRFMQTPMHYPQNYGFIPHTLSGDGDPCDVLVVTRAPLMPGSVIKVRPVGVLLMEDESGADEKIIAVPTDKLDIYYSDIKTYKDFNQACLSSIEHFFSHYKDLEKGKWVKIKGWEGENTAKTLIKEGIERGAKGK